MGKFIYFGHRMDREIFQKEGRKKTVVYRRNVEERSEIQIYDGNGNWEDIAGMWCDYFYHYGSGQELYDISEEEAGIIMENFDAKNSMG